MNSFMHANRAIALNSVTAPILRDATERRDPLFCDCITEMLRTGRIHTTDSNELDRNDRRNLLILRDHIQTFNF